MKNDFFTLGGTQFWEDLFFYQDWRIQRNCVSGKCRLLDNLNIRRYEGSFDECRKVFTDYAEAYELPKQNKNAVIMIHSIGQSKNFFKTMRRRIINDDYLPVTVNYPSSQKSLKEHTNQFHFFLDHLEDVERISFVTFGAGSTIVQELFKEQAPWQSKLNVERCVFINPFVTGNKIIENLYKNEFVKFVIGPMGGDLSTENIKKLKPLQNVETGVILTDSSIWGKLLEVLTFSAKDTSSYDEIKRATGAKKVFNLPCSNINVLKNKKIYDAIMSFLLKGKF